MKYIIASTAVVDEIHFPGSNSNITVAGGAGIYALCGVKCWDNDVLLATGVGADFSSLYGDWFKKNKLGTEGLIVKDEKTPHTIIQYFENGERIETPMYGPEHYKKIEITPEELEPYFREAKGIYIFKNSNKSFWDKIIPMKKSSDVKVMWEIANDSTYFENRDNIKNICKNIDILSINLIESKNLLGTDDLPSMIKTFQSWGQKLTFLRCGAQGSIMITGEKAVEIPSEKDVNVVDSTGAGNSSSGSVLYGYCEGKSLEDCGRMGSMSAAVCIRQYGVPEHIPSLKIS